MSNKIKAAGYITQDNDGSAIYGAGLTEAEAWAETAEAGPFFGGGAGDTITNQEAFDTQFDIWPATQALIDLVKERGGSISWYHLDGVACTDEEYEAAQ